MFFTFIIKSSTDTKTCPISILKRCAPLSLRIVSMSLSSISESFSYISTEFVSLLLLSPFTPFEDNVSMGNSSEGSLLQWFYLMEISISEGYWLIHNHMHILHNIYRFHLVPGHKQDIICILLASTSSVFCQFKNKQDHFGSSSSIEKWTKCDQPQKWMVHICLNYIVLYMIFELHVFSRCTNGMRTQSYLVLYRWYEKGFSILFIHNLTV